MSGSILKNDTALLAALRVAAFDQTRRRDAVSAPSPCAAPFVTISRQSGAGGRVLAKQLADRLNAVDPGQLPWTTWDNELVEKVASEHYVSAAQVESLEDERASWFEECLAGLALAEMGRVIIVGRGGAFITRDMPGGLHIRLVAPFDYRVETKARQLNLSKAAAETVVRERDRNREAFYRRHWPSRPLTPESFTATFNTAAIPAEQLVECVLPLLAVGTSRLPNAWLKARTNEPPVACGLSI